MTNHELVAEHMLATSLEVNKIKAAELALTANHTSVAQLTSVPQVAVAAKLTSVPQVELAQDTLPQSEAYVSIETSPQLALAQITELCDKDLVSHERVTERIPSTMTNSQIQSQSQSIKKDELKDLIESNKKFSNTTRDIDIHHREETFSNRVMDEESYSDSNLDYSESEYTGKAYDSTGKAYDRTLSRYQKNTKTFVPELIIEDKTGSASINFESLIDLKKYYDKHRDSYSQMPTQKINKLLHCDGYKFSKSGGIFKIIIDNNESSSTTSKTRETWKNKSIELEKSIQILQQENLRLSEDVNALANKLIKAYSKISSQSRDIENLTKVVTNMYEIQIPALINKINKLKLANEYYKRQ